MKNSIYRVDLKCCSTEPYNKAVFCSPSCRWAAITYISNLVTTSSHVLSAIVKLFESHGWKIHHRFDHNPALISKLGYGDRRFGKSDDVNPIYIPEPNLTLSKNGKGLLLEIDYKFSKKSFMNIATIRKIKKKNTYLKRFFGGRIPKRILYGIAIPNLSLHVARGVEHIKNLDFFLCATKSGEVFKIKAPTNPAFSPLGKFQKFHIKKEAFGEKN